jgi:hypothetical protein
VSSLEAAIDKGNAKVTTLGPAAEQASSKASAAFSKWGAKVIEVNQALDLLSRGKAAFDQFVLGPLRAIDHLDKLSVRTGISVEKMGALSLGAQLAGADIDELVLGVDRFARSLASAGDPTSDQAVLLRALGVTSRDTFPALEQLAHGLKGVGDAATRTDVAYTLLGRGGARLIAFLDDQSEGFADLEKQASNLGLTFDSKTSKAAVRVNDNITRLGAATSGILQKAIIELLPDLDRAAEVTERWAESNRDVVSSGFANYVREVGSLFGWLDKLTDLPADLISRFLVPQRTDPFVTADQQSRVEARKREIADLAAAQKGRPVPISAGGALDLTPPGVGVLELSPSGGPGSAELQGETARAVAARAAIEVARRSPVERSFQAQAAALHVADLLAAEAGGLKAVAAGKQLVLDRDQALGATEQKLRADAVAIRDAELAYIAKQRQAIQARIGLDNDALKNEGLGLDAAKSRAENVGKLRQDQAALKDLDTQAATARQKADIAIVESMQKELALSPQLAAIDSERASNKATYLQQVLSEAQAMGATHAEQLAFAAQIDAAETTSLEAKRHSIELAKQQAEAQPEGVKRTIEVAGLSSELENVNLELSLAGHNVRSLQHEFINLGDTIRGATTDLVKNLVSGDFENAGKGFGKAFIDKFIESTIGEKLKNFDPQMKANLLEYIPGLGSLGGEKTGGNFIDALVSATGKGTGAAGTSFNDALLQLNSSGTPDQAAQAQQLLSAAGYTPDQIQTATASGTFGGVAPAAAPAGDTGGGGGGGNSIQGMLKQYQQAKQLTIWLPGPALLPRRG